MTKTNASRTTESLYDGVVPSSLATYCDTGWKIAFPLPLVKKAIGRKKLWIKKGWLDELITDHNQLINLLFNLT